MAEHEIRHEGALWDRVVWRDPERMSGAPCFSGTRVPIETFFDFLEGGDTIDEFLAAFPGVTREQAIGALCLGKERLLGDVYAGRFA